MKLHFKPNKKQSFELIFAFIIVIIFITKTCSGHGGTPTPSAESAEGDPALSFNGKDSDTTDTLALAAIQCDSILRAPSPHPTSVASSPTPHKIYSVSDYSMAFPDINVVQIASARYHGITPQATRKDLEKVAQASMVSVNYSPYYTVGKLTNSSPYLVPRAQKLLNRIGRNFIDSLLIKHIPPSLIIVTSVTRTLEDIQNLKVGNGNAIETSCHSYGTTIDISYNKYEAFKDSQGNPVRQARNDTLKWVLSEVLNDLRQAGACYVKHERKQGCFHITVR